MGRGTTVIEAALAGRTPAGCDINPLSAMLAQPRLSPPTAEEVAREARRRSICRARSTYPRELEVFYHPDTLARNLRAARIPAARATRRGSLDGIDRWIRMVAVNRLTGHSPGFFSVYTLPPNQAASVEAQAKINARRKQVPPRRDVRALIRQRRDRCSTDCDAAARATLLRSAQRAALLTRPARSTPAAQDRFGQPGGHLAAVSRRRELRGRQLAARLVLRHRHRRLSRFRCTGRSTDWQAAMTSVLPRARARAAARRPRGVRGRRSARRQGEAGRSGAARAAWRRGSSRCWSSSTRSSSPRRRTAGASATTRRERTRTGLSSSGKLSANRSG